MTAKARRPSAFAAMLAVVLTATVWSAVRPADRATWFFELFVGAAGIGVLVATRRRFPFSALLYAVVAVHYVVLAVGAKYTYAEAPPGEWLRALTGGDRNHFDRLGHFFQGVTPALVAREVLLRAAGLRPGPLVAVLSVSVALSFSALYEVLEWFWVAAFYPGRGPEWLGHQGDPWDAQADMLMALLGGLCAAVLPALPVGPSTNRPRRDS